MENKTETEQETFEILKVLAQSRQLTREETIKYILAKEAIGESLDKLEQRICTLTKVMELLRGDRQNLLAYGKLLDLARNGIEFSLTEIMPKKELLKKITLTNLIKKHTDLKIIKRQSTAIRGYSEEYGDFEVTIPFKECETCTIDLRGSWRKLTDEAKEHNNEKMHKIMEALKAGGIKFTRLSATSIEVNRIISK